MTRRIYTDQELLACLREASSNLGGVLTADGYSDFARRRKLADDRPWPTHQAPMLRFGSWRKALKAAGLRSNPSSPIRGQNLFSDEECLDAVRVLSTRLGRAPTAMEYEQFAAGMNGAVPSAATVRKRLRASVGRWREIVERASPDEN